jgi:hypothetical protein
MFTKDFKKHCEAVQVLQDSLQDSPADIAGTIDLLFRQVLLLL